MGLYGSIFGLCVNFYIQRQRQRQRKRTKIEREQLFGFGEQVKLAGCKCSKFRFLTI